MFYLMSSHAQSSFISDNLNYYKIPHRVHVVSGSQTLIIIAGTVSGNALQFINRFNFRRAEK